MSNDPVDLKKHNMGLIVRLRNREGSATDLEENDKYYNRPIESRRAIQSLGIQELVIALYDSAREDIGKYFKQAISAIHSARMRGVNVLVHCDMGISRSSTIIMAYQIWLAAHRIENTMPPVDYLIDSLRQRRGIVNPNPGFTRTLQRYHTAWHQTRERCREYRRILAADFPVTRQSRLDRTRSLMQNAGRMITQQFQ